MKHILRHETLDCYQLAVEVARWVRGTSFPTGDSALKDQARRCADSVVLNIAEGCQRRGRDKARHLTYAQGSAAEACAVLDLMDFDEGPERQRQLRRIVAMLSKLK